MPVKTLGAERFQVFLTNSIDWEAVRNKRIAAIIGDSPSKYAKSPVVWNAGFEALGIEAVFLPFDVPEAHLEGLLNAMRQENRLLGFSVTVPYKMKIIPLLDGLDEKARVIGAVNTVARTPDGQFIGYNTDGQGGVDSLLRISPAGSEPPLSTLKGKQVLLLGAGGAARALAFYLGEILENGRLYLANRDVKKAESLCIELEKHCGKGEPLSEKEIPKVASRVEVVINATTKGQQGLRRLPDGTATCLEPYSALAPADPPSLPIEAEETFLPSWTRAALKDIQQNQQKSFEFLLNIPSKTFLFDIIYAPLETVFLKQGRWTGHRTQNGKSMNIAQAADGFHEKVVKSLLKEKGLYTPDTYQRLFDAMMAKW